MSDQLETKIKALNVERCQIQSEIDAIADQMPKQKVLEAISKQKYFYLKELPHAIFDRDTSYLWPEKKLDTSKIKVELTGENLADKDEVKQLADELKSIDYLSFKGWEIPTPSDLRTICDEVNRSGSNNLPCLAYKNDDIHFVSKYNHQQNTILNYNDCLIILNEWRNHSDNHTENIYLNLIQQEKPRKIIFENRFDRSWTIDAQTKGELQSKQFFLVNKSFAIDEYKLDPSFEKFSDKEKEVAIAKLDQKAREDFLKVILKNKFVPIFDNHKIYPLYELLLINLPNLIFQLSEVEARLDELNAINHQQRELLSSRFKYQDLLAFKKFNCHEIDMSPIRFANATIDWCELLQTKLTEYQIRQHKLITEGNAITYNLSRKYKHDGNLTKNENELLEKRQTFMFERLNMDMNTPIANLASMKLQCYALKKKLFDLNTDDNGLVKLGQFASEPRPSFDLVAENSATMLTDSLKRIEFYEDNRSLVNSLINSEREWSKDLKVVKSVSKENLKLECEEDDIEEIHWQAWFSDWSDKRWLIEQCLQPLIEKGIEGAFVYHNLNTTTPLVIQLIDLLTQYKNKVDNFYLCDRKSIHQKFAFQPDGHLQEKFESENELYKHTVTFQEQLHDIIFSLEKVEERLWLFHWSDALIDMAIDTILDFIRDKDLDGISKTVIGDFTQLRLQNYSTFINDAKAHSEMSAKWDKEYSSLMFKMRKELNETTVEKV
ncbi:hypothetical protein AB733_23405 [Photobacterium swingsii]|uniref:Uncharacterized protein n=1 Tax=Photobacterium swingsii TaxID=680026 RepID=A0A0J8V572_9GAMM|nr:hypothetical protein [Photobacterium swingsii]KMV28476.1 hypothetical protein AB733_23405 [Photobacterium swingsii]PSW22770.1 hypothetical protein C9I94_18480 [Photobacterium swingsii]